jgi:hypothetical protein
MAEVIFERWITYLQSFHNNNIPTYYYYYYYYQLRFHQFDENDIYTLIATAPGPLPDALCTRSLAPEAEAAYSSPRLITCCRAASSVAM